MSRRQGAIGGLEVTERSSGLSEQEEVLLCGEETKLRVEKRCIDEEVRMRNTG